MAEMFAITKAEYRDYIGGILCALHASLTYDLFTSDINFDENNNYNCKNDILGLYAQ